MLSQIFAVAAPWTFNKPTGTRAENAKRCTSRSPPPHTKHAALRLRIFASGCFSQQALVHLRVGFLRPQLSQRQGVALSSQAFKPFHAFGLHQAAFLHLIPQFAQCSVLDLTHPLARDT